MTSVVSIDLVYYLIGAIVMIVAGMTLRDASNPKRYTTAAFWFLFGSSFLFGDLMIAAFGKQTTYRLVGAIVLIIAAIAGANLLGAGSVTDHRAQARRRSSELLGNRLFIPALAIPLITVLLTLFGKDFMIGGVHFLDQKNLTLTSLALACIGAIVIGQRITGSSPVIAIRESRRLVDAIGWALILPQMLAMLGGVFVAAQTGNSIKTIVNLFVDPAGRFALVTIYCVGMAVFTMIMGNAFAAFPVMTAGIALPFLILQHQGNPAAIVAIGMFAGYCGTLMTPMAANFNIVPAALLELKDKHQVIKIQIPTALCVLVCNIFLMYFLAFA